MHFEQSEHITRLQRDFMKTNFARDRSKETQRAREGEYHNYKAEWRMLNESLKEGTKTKTQ